MPVNVKKDDMGDVVKDFYKSDAPQFKGKSKKKRREMAIAAKLSAEESFEIDKDAHNKAKKKAKLRNLARGNENPAEKKAAQRKAGGPKLAFEGWKEKAAAAIKRVVKKKEEKKPEPPTGAEKKIQDWRKKARKRDHETVNFLDPDD